MQLTGLHHKTLSTIATPHLLSFQALRTLCTVLCTECNARNVWDQTKALDTAPSSTRSMFDDLPDGCVAHVIEKLCSVQDVVNFQTTCSRHAAIGRTHQAAWLLLLRKDFDLRLQVRAHCSHGTILTCKSDENSTACTGLSGHSIFRRASLIQKCSQMSITQNSLQRVLHRRWCR